MYFFLHLAKTKKKTLCAIVATNNLRPSRVAVEPVEGELCFRADGEQHSWVLPEHSDPVGKVGGVVVARGRREPESCAPERSAELGDEFLARRSCRGPPTPGRNAQEYAHGKDGDHRMDEQQCRADHDRPSGPAVTLRIR